MREDINFKGADTESYFWLISILCSGYEIAFYLFNLIVSRLRVQTLCRHL